MSLIGAPGDDLGQNRLYDSNGLIQFGACLGEIGRGSRGRGLRSGCRCIGLVDFAGERACRVLTADIGLHVGEDLVSLGKISGDSVKRRIILQGGKVIGRFHSRFAFLNALFRFGQVVQSAGVVTTDGLRGRGGKQGICLRHRRRRGAFRANGVEFRLQRGQFGVVVLTIHRVGQGCRPVWFGPVQKSCCRGKTFGRDFAIGLIPVRFHVQDELFDTLFAGMSFKRG